MNTENCKVSLKELNKNNTTFMKWNVEIKTAILLTGLMQSVLKFQLLYFVEIEKLTLKFVWNYKGPPKSK